MTIALTTLSWLFFNGIHYYLFHIQEDPHMIKTIQRYCSTDLQYFLFDNESYQKTAMAFLFIGSILGILIEYRYFFDSNFDKFARYNMGENRWTQTDEHKTALRMIVMYFTAHLIMPRTKWGDIHRDSVAYLNFSMNIFSNFCKGLFYFVFIKMIFKAFRMTNEPKEEVKGINEGGEGSKEPLLNKREINEKN